MLNTIKRLQGALNYLGGAEPVIRWRFVAADCPLCGPSCFVKLGRGPFLARCLKCKANVTNLSIIRVIQQLMDTELFSGYEMSTYGATYDFLKRRCLLFECSEYFPGRPLGEKMGGIRNEDAQQLTFADNSFDIITSNQVFEHVPDDRKCFQECWRTLKPGGSLLFTVPLYHTHKTEQVATLQGGRLRWLLEPEFHASRTAGPNSVPVFWRFSVNDIVARVSAVEFHSVSLVRVIIFAQQYEPQIVIHAVK